MIWVHQLPMVGEIGYLGAIFVCDYLTYNSLIKTQSQVRPKKYLYGIWNNWVLGKTKQSAIGGRENSNG